MPPWFLRELSWSLFPEMTEGPGSVRYIWYGAYGTGQVLTVLYNEENWEKGWDRKRGDTRAYQE